MSATTTSILLVDDHQIIRQGLRRLLESNEDFKVIGEAGDGRSAIVIAEKLKPDIIVMDITMPDMNGIDATRRLCTLSPEVGIVALSQHSDRKFADEMLNAGARAYLLKDGAYEELAQAIRSVVAGNVYLSSRITPPVLHAVPKTEGKNGNGNGNGHANVFAKLSPREREVLQLLAEGKSTKGVAFELSVSTKTVETHRRQIMDKLNLDNIAQLTKYAVREGLTSLES